MNRIYSQYYIVFLSSFLFCSSYASSLDNLIKVRFTPLGSYIYKKDGQLQGEGYEKLKAILNRAKFQYDFKEENWSRVYNQTLLKENFCIIGLARTPLREELFHWIAPFAKQEKIFFFKLRSRDELVKEIDLTKRSIGVERFSYTDQFLQANNFLYINPVNKSEQFIKMLVSKRVDFILIEEGYFKESIRKLKLDRQLFEKHKLAFTSQAYIALSKKSSPETLKRMKQAYSEILADAEKQKALELK